MVVRGSNFSAVIVMRRAKDEGEVRKVWNAVWRVWEAVMPDCIFLGRVSFLGFEVLGWDVGVL